MTTTVNESYRNGVDTATLFATLDAVKAAPEAARFQFRANNEWISGTHSRGTIDGFFGVGEERSHERSFHFDADHPAVLVGRDNGPTPVEYVLHALAACLTAGLANIAAARGVRRAACSSCAPGRRPATPSSTSRSPSKVSPSRARRSGPSAEWTCTVVVRHVWNTRLRCSVPVSAASTRRG